MGGGREMPLNESADLVWPVAPEEDSITNYKTRAKSKQWCYKQEPYELHGPVVYLQNMAICFKAV